MITVTTAGETATVDEDPYGLTLPASLTSAAVGEYARRAGLDPMVAFGGKQNSGLIDPTARLTVYTSMVTLHDGDVLANGDFRGGLQIAGNGQVWNSIVSSTRPDYVVRGTSKSNLQGLYGSLFVGVIFDGMKASEYSACIDANYSTQLFCEYRNGVDGLDFTAPTTLDQPTLIVLPYVHDTASIPAPKTHPNDAPPQMTHPDGVQGQRGKNITVLGMYSESITMQAVLVKQEVSSSTVDKIDQVFIGNLHVGPGCKTGVNLSVNLGNSLATVTIDSPVFDVEMKARIAIIANTKQGDPAQFLGKIINPRYSDGTVAPITKGA